MDKDNRQITMSVIMTPDKANFTGNVHGGHLLCFLDQVAYACAAQYAGTEVVTLSVDQVLFKQPVYISDLITCFANINYVGRTSMEVGIRTEAKNLKTQDIRHVLSCRFTMVAVDDQMTPSNIQTFTPSTDEEKRRWHAADNRRQKRAK